MGCRIETLLLLLCIGFGIAASPARGAVVENCLGTPGHAPVIWRCDHGTTWSVRGPSLHQVWPKARTQDLLDQMVREFLSVHAPELSRAAIDIAFWITAPENNPSAAQGRLLVTVGDLHFMLLVPLDSARWTATAANSAVFSAGSTYPESYGYRSATLLLKRNESATEADFDAFVTQVTGIDSAPESFSGLWYVLGTPVFAESRTEALLASANGSPSMIAATGLNHLMEWIAWRDPVFAFSLPTVE